MIDRLWSLLKEKVMSGNRRLQAAMAGYIALIGVALYVLLPVHTRDDSFLLIMVIGILTYLMLRTLSHSIDE